MSYSKRQFVEAAFEELGLASYVFDLTPESLQSAVRRLDAMMAAWDANGIQIGYPLSLNPENADLDADTNVLAQANEAIILGLAIKLAPSYGKVVAQDTKAGAKAGFDALLKLAAMPMPAQYPSTLPTGAGNLRAGILRPFQPDPQMGPINLAGNGQLSIG